jgi:hypothetical protein
VTKRSTSSAAGKAVAKRGIVLGSGHDNRSAQGSRFPENARKSAQATVRKALRKP